MIKDGSLRRLAIAWSCSWIGLGAVQSSLVLFTGYRFGWGPGLNGIVLAGVGLSQAMVEGLLLRHITARLGEQRTAIAGYISGAAGYAMLAAPFASWIVAPRGGADVARRPGYAVGFGQWSPVKARWTARARCRESCQLSKG